MPKPPHHEEIEIKLPVLDTVMLRGLLKRLRAREISPRTYESNTLYDTPRHDLRRHGRLIRIRIEFPASSFGKRPPNENAPAILTYKAPSLTSHSSKHSSNKTGGRSKFLKDFKIKEEVEVSVAGADEIARILHALGLHPVFRYEKFRTTYVLPGLQGLKVELDETPIGIYLELEGPPAGIDRAARLLGYNRNDYLKATYGSLYLADCHRRNEKPGDMLFPIAKKMR